MEEERILTDVTDNWTDEDWIMLLWTFMTDFPENEWNEFVHDLIYKNRFSVSSKVVDSIVEYAEKCERVIPQGTILYRARIYKTDPLREFLSMVFRNKTEIQCGDNDNSCEYYNSRIVALLMEIKNDTPSGKRIKELYNEWKQKEYKGFAATESGAPPASKASAGRINPERVKYLYLSEDPWTAAYEVRPIIGQHISVAAFRVKEQIKVYDLMWKNGQEIEKSKVDMDYALFEVIQKHFSEPNTGDELEYLPTQFLGEKIKSLGVL